MSPAVETRQYVAEQLRGVNREQRTLDIIASDFSIDSYGTRIDPAGWELEQFKKNGPICVQHDSYTRNGLPVAQAIGETVRVEGDKLMMRVQFPPAGVDETADRVFELAAAGILRGVSVGFDPLEWEDVTERMPDGREIKVRIFRRHRLMEVSLVTIPSNDNALVQRAAKRNLEAEDVRALTVELEEQLRKEKKTVDVRVTDLPVVQKHLTELREQVAEMQKDYDKYKGYFERKQPANRAATKALEKFYKRILKEEPNADEVRAWERMAEAIEAMEETTEGQPEAQPAEQPAEEVTPQETPVEPTPEETVTATAETVVESPEETTPPSTPAPAEEAPQPERTASVQVSVHDLLVIVERMSRKYVESGVEALLRGTPAKDVGTLIDGLNQSVTASLSTSPHHGKH